MGWRADDVQDRAKTQEQGREDGAQGSGACAWVLAGHMVPVLSGAIGMCARCISVLVRRM